MEQVLGHLTLCSLWGHVTKFIINAELIWLPWLTLSDFSLGYICLRGENDCRRAERLFPSSNTFGPVTAELRTLTSKLDPRALEDSKWHHGQKMVSASFCFFLLFLNSDREVVCLEFARLSGEEKEEFVVAIPILYTCKNSFQDMFLCLHGLSLLPWSLITFFFQLWGLWCLINRTNKSFPYYCIKI